jgi:hypothetical protein
VQHSPRIAAWLALALYLAAATAPCAVSPFDVAVAQTLAAAQPDDAARPAPILMPKCPCRCTDRPHAGGVPTAPGYALLRTRPDIGPHPFLLPLASPVDAFRTAPFQAVDPIPI